MLKLYDFSVNYSIDPTLVPQKNIRFGWKLESEERNVVQESYRIVIRKDSEIIADTGVVCSRQYFNVGIAGLELASKSDYSVSITVTDNKGNTAELCRCVSTGLQPDEWNAMWIKPDRHIDGWAPYLRTKFEVRGVKKAIMYACGLGCAEYYINGKKTGDCYLDPPATNYEKKILYRRFDVTDMIRDGGNAVVILLGEGFYAQSRVWTVDGLKYGDVCAILRLEMLLEDGTVKVVTTNTEDWKYKYSPITVNNVYGGETYDCRLETPDFSEFEGSDRGWERVVEDHTPKGILEPCFMPPVRVVRELPAVSVRCVSGKDDGAWIFDIGENIAGIVEFTLPPAPRGAVFVFRYAENLTESGQVDLRSTGAFATQCIQQDIYISRGDPEGELYRPRFTYHGFRYVEVSGVFDISEGYGTVPKTSLVRAIQLSTGMKAAAEIHTSDKDFNDLLRIMKNTFISNFHGYPEDCPAREKCGWLGDAQVVCNYGLLNFDSVPSYKKYLDDIRTTREVYGTWQMIAPGKRTCGEATPLWGCAQVIIPYYMYKYCGDTDAVLENFDLMEAWVENELNKSKDLIIYEGLGDWCPPKENDNPRKMPVEHSSTLIFYEVCLRMAELCAVFETGNEDYYSKLAERIKNAFILKFYDHDNHTYGYWGTDGVALETGLYPERERADLLKNLVETIQRDDFEMPTAIYANKYLVPLLVKEGYGDHAFEFLFNRRHPSFSTMMDDGATTVWEAVDMKNIADVTAGVASYNHPIHGGFLYFAITDICGLNPHKPGFAKIRFAPRTVSAIKEFSAEVDLICGKASVSMCSEGDIYTYTLTLPAGVTAIANIDGSVCVDGEAYERDTEIGSGTHVITVQ